MSESNIQEKIDGKYKIIEKIGSGGQANIFLVIKIGKNEENAAKVFKENLLCAPLSALQLSQTYSQAVRYIN